MPDLVLMAGGDLLGPVGAFGKMPSQGDFFWLDLPQGFATGWDAWLSAAMQAARIALGNRWQECYYSAPIWRFSLPPGLVGPRALRGVLMPSVDRVGRAFPLTLVAPVRPDAASAQSHLAQTSAFEAMEDVALDALEFETTLPDLRARLDLLSNGEAPRVATAASADVSGDDVLLDLLDQPAEPETVQAGASIPDASLDKSGGEPILPAAFRLPAARCFWSAFANGAMLHLATQALPSARQLAAMFDLSDPFWIPEAAE